MKKIFEISKEYIGKRIDNTLVFLTNRSRNIIQRLIQEKNVIFNSEIVEKKSFLLKEGKIEIYFPEPKKLEIKAEDIPLEIIYQDEYIAIINKFPGVIIHPSSVCKENTLVNALLYHIKDLSDIGGIIGPGIVHRLDKNTSGVMIVTKCNKADLNLSEDFKNRKIEKKYLAIVKGNLKNKEGEIKTLIGRDKKDREKMSIKVTRGKEAYSKYKVIEEVENFSLLEIELKTGRTHQIRVHLSSLGYPILGDEIYGKKEKFLRQMLHSYSLTFKHPINKEEVNFKAFLPKDFLKVLRKLNFNYEEK